MSDNMNQQQETVIYEYTTAQWIKTGAIVSAIAAVISFILMICGKFVFLVVLLLALIVLCFFLCCFCSLTITDKRVTGKVPVGKRVDLPISHITAVSSEIGCIIITTPTGAIRFYFVADKDKAYSELNRLIIESHGK